MGGPDSIPLGVSMSESRERRLGRLGGVLPRLSEEEIEVLDRFVLFLSEGMCPNCRSQLEPMELEADDLARGYCPESRQEFWVRRFDPTGYDLLGWRLHDEAPKVASTHE